MKMKKLLCCIAAMLMIGCTDNNAEALTMSDICIFRQRSDGVPIKTTVTSGITSTVCVDPLCLHDEKCPLYGALNMGENGAVIIEDTYCFVSTDLSEQKNTEERLCAYNMTNGEILVLKTYHDGILLICGYDNFLYYAVTVSDKTDEGIKNSYFMYRADVESGKIIEIPMDTEYSSSGNINTADFPQIYVVDGNLIYWYVPGEDGYEFYTTDLAGKRRRELPMNNSYVMNGEYYDGWAYYTVYKNGGRFDECKTQLDRLKYQNEKILRRCSFDTGRDELVCENLSEYIVTEDGIYFTVFEDSPKEIMHNGETFYDIYAGRIYHMNSDGSDAKLLCTLENVDLSVYNGLFLGYIDRKLALAYMDEIENNYYDSGNDYNISPDIIISDTANGTWYVSENQ